MMLVAYYIVLNNEKKEILLKAGEYMNEGSRLKIVSYNIHKGFSRFRKLKIHSLKEKIFLWDPDIIFLQEVQGQHDKYARKKAWPQTTQYDFLGHEHWPYKAYGPNKFYEHGHHGNAILSRYPIKKMVNYDISTSKMERRGALYAQIEHPSGLINAVCLHLSLLAKDRDWQFNEVSKIILNEINEGESLIIAGDFNDWSNKSRKYFVDKLDCREVLSAYNGGKPLKSFPSEFPLLALDRIYAKNITPVNASIIKDCDKISDHSPVKAEFELKNK